MPRGGGSAGSKGLSWYQVASCPAAQPHQRAHVHANAGRGTHAPVCALGTAPSSPRVGLHVVVLAVLVHNELHGARIPAERGINACV